MYVPRIRGGNCGTYECVSAARYQHAVSWTYISHRGYWDEMLVVRNMKTSILPVLLMGVQVIN